MGMKATAAKGIYFGHFVNKLRYFVIRAFDRGCKKMMAENVRQDSGTEQNGDGTIEGAPGMVAEEGIAYHKSKDDDIDGGAPGAEEEEENLSDDKTKEEVVEAETKDDKTETDFLEDITVDPAIVDKLTHGTLALFLPNLQKAKGSLNEVLHNQEVLIETVQQENAKFTDSVATKKLIDTSIKMRQYHTKLVNLKKEMANLMERSTRLKRRAVKLQQQKQKDELQRAAQRERELEKERMLTAKVAKHSTDVKTEKEPS